MVQPTHDWKSDHLVACIVRARNRSELYRDLLPNPLMRSCLVEVDHIGIERALELPLMQNQQVIEAFLPHAPGEALTDRIGLWPVIGGCENLDATGPRHSSEARPKFGIVLTYFWMVRLHTRMPSFRSSPRIRSAPHSRLFMAISPPQGDGFCSYLRLMRSGL